MNIIVFVLSCLMHKYHKATLPDIANNCLKKRAGLCLTLLHLQLDPVQADKTPGLIEITILFLHSDINHDRSF